MDKPNALILDSFAGSGTTAHAVLEANRRDGGQRKFILVEMEDYADTVTAERIRRVAGGYSFTGTLRETLFRERITLTRLQNATGLLERVEALCDLHSPSFDRITKSVTAGELIVVGETDVEQDAEGLGGSFTYCTLGDPIEMDNLLTGEALPSLEALASVLFHTATNTPLSTDVMETDPLDQPGHTYLGEASGMHVWLIYQPELAFLKSSDAALTLAKARSIAEAKDGRHVVFAPARFVSQKMLNDENLPVEFAPLPFALYRVERE